MFKSCLRTRAGDPSTVYFIPLFLLFNFQLKMNQRVRFKNIKTQNLCAVFMLTDKVSLDDANTK